jgi:hypothetical protein
MGNRFFFFSLSSITMPARRENIEGGDLHAVTTNMIVTKSLDLARSSKKHIHGQLLFLSLQLPC